MTKKIRVADLPEFDFSEHLGCEAAIIEYLNAVLDDGDLALLAAALDDIARASGLTRDALYKALRPDVQPRFDTISKVCRALGVKLHAEPLST